MKILQTIFLSLIIICLSGFSAAAQEYTLKGHIYDQQTHHPLSFVYILTADSSASTSSDNKGFFEITTSKAEGNLLFSLVGYHQKSFHFKGSRNHLAIYLNPGGVTLNTVVVKSFNSNRANKNTPGAIGVISRQRIEQGSGVSLQSSLNSIPGVQMDQSNLADSRISIRGSGTRSPWGIRNTKIYINDIPVTETDGTTRIESIDVGDLGRAEVIRGPASSIYGGNTTGGVINFYLKRAPYGTKTLKATGLIGSYGLERVSTTYASGSKDLNTFLAYGWQQYGGYREHSHDYRRFFAGNFQFFPSERQTITLLLSRTSQDSQIPGALTLPQVKQNRRQANPLDLSKKAGRYQRWTRVGLGQQYRFNDKFSNSTSVFSYFYDLHHPLPFAVLRNFYQSYGGRTHFTYRPGFKTLATKFTLGGEFNQSLTKGTQYFNDHGQEKQLTSNTDNKNVYYTLFYQSETKLTSKMRLTLGLSYNNLTYRIRDYLHEAKSGEKEFKGQFSPRIALSYDFGHSLSLHASVSKGFAAPTGTQISNPDGTLNQQVGAEKALNYEIDAKGAFLDSRIDYTLSLYTMSLKGELIGQTLSPGITVYHNSGKSIHQGAELALSYHLLNHRDNRFIKTLTPYFSASYSHFRFKDYKILNAQGAVTADYAHHQLAGIAPWRLYLGIDVETRTGFYLTGNYLFNDRLALNDANTDYNPAYHVLNGKIGYKTKLFHHFTIDIYAGLNNILDEKYTSFTQLNAVAHGNQPPAYYNPSPGINGYGGVNLSYQFE